MFDIHKIKEIKLKEEPYLPMYKRIKKRKILVVLVKTIDAFLFSIKIADNKNSDKKKGIELTDLTNNDVLTIFQKK